MTGFALGGAIRRLGVEGVPLEAKAGCLINNRFGSEPFGDFCSEFFAENSLAEMLAPDKDG